MKPLLRRTLVFIAAVVATCVLASLFSTQFVLAGLQGIGIPIPFADLGILKALVPLAGIALLIAFLIAGLAVAKIGGNRNAWFAVGGFAAMVALLMIIKAALGVMPVSGARSIAGILFQGIAGGVGGVLFAYLTKPSAITEGRHA